MRLRRIFFLPISAFFKAGASLTPSPVIAETSFMDCKYSTILDLWNGSTRANILDRATAARCSETDKSSNSRPEKAWPKKMINYFREIDSS